LLAAFADVLNVRPDAILLLAGEGPEAGALESLARRLGLEGRVHFLGYVDPSNAYAACDVVVLPSRSEGMPLVILEAMARGRTVIATRVGAVAETITDGTDGRVVEVHQRHVSSAIVELLTDPEALERMGTAARQTFVDRFSAEEMTNGYVKLYERLLRASPRSARS
jgi:glycosyltransferase involved in cell wall biosynthesis